LTRTDRFDIKPDKGGSVKAENDWRDVERPQVAMHRNCHIF